MNALQIVTTLIGLAFEIAKAFQLSNDDLREAVEKGLAKESATEAALEAFHDRWGKPE